MATIAQLLAMHSSLHSDTAKLDAEVLLSHVINKPRSYLYTWPERVINPEHSDKYTALIEQRAAGQPIAHLTGKREFWSLPLTVNSSTLIPRPDTEQLVATALKLGESLEKNTTNPIRLLDLGTGTGAIALAIASEQPNWLITAVDKFDAVVSLAEKNRQTLGLNNVTMLQSDWFEAVTSRFEIIVSNPPYIDQQDPHLKQGDVAHEPSTALVAADNGMADIAQIITQAKNHLSPNGWLIIEHGYQQATTTAKLFAQADFDAITTQQDFAGKDRLTRAKIKG